MSRTTFREQSSNIQTNMCTGNTKCLNQMEAGA